MPLAAVPARAVSAPMAADRAGSVARVAPPTLQAAAARVAPQSPLGPLAAPQRDRPERVGSDRPETGSDKPEPAPDTAPAAAAAGKARLGYRLADAAGRRRKCCRIELRPALLQGFRRSRAKARRYGPWNLNGDREQPGLRASLRCVRLTFRLRQFQGSACKEAETQAACRPLIPDYRLLTAWRPRLVIAGRLGATALRQRRTARAMRSGRPGEVGTMRLLPAIGLRLLLRRRHIDGVV